MARIMSLGNGRLLVNYDQRWTVRELFFPEVGMANHLAYFGARLALWVDGNFTWPGGNAWQRHVRYKDWSLVGEFSLSREDVGLELKITAAVHHRLDVLLYDIEVSNTRDAAKKVELVFTHDWAISGNDVGDTALYDPTTDAMLQYKRDRFFLVSGHSPAGGPDAFSASKRHEPRYSGVWHDVSHCHLNRSPISQGAVSSAFSLSASVPVGETVHYAYWLCAGKSIDEVRMLQARIKETGVARLIAETESYWREWTRMDERFFADLSAEIKESFATSLLVTRSQIDAGGAILASTDMESLDFGRDHYGYVWPRDAALICLALDRAAYPHTTRKYFRFSTRVLAPEGYMWHRYHPDGSLGSSWHPWYQDGENQLPIQEDETALCLYALGEHYLRHRDLEFLESVWPEYEQMADFLCRYVDKSTGLPEPSYDLWEERRGIFTFTASAVIAGLLKAADMARIFRGKTQEEKYRNQAAAISHALGNLLYHPDANRFLRGVYKRGDTIEEDLTPDSSVFALWRFGIIPPDDPRMVRTYRNLQESLSVKTKVGGYARYYADYYHKRSDDFHQVPGNPWVICTLWMAQYLGATARSIEELRAARDLLEKVTTWRLESGIMPEQVDPFSAEPLSVAPLTWSHSEFVLSVIDYAKKYRDLSAPC
ncbi:MAG: glycoside hydrolase family 15 protein [Bacillota bacterium]